MSPPSVLAHPSSCATQAGSVPWSAIGPTWATVKSAPVFLVNHRAAAIRSHMLAGRLETRLVSPTLPPMTLLASDVRDAAEAIVSQVTGKWERRMKTKKRLLCD